MGRPEDDLIYPHDHRSWAWRILILALTVSLACSLWELLGRGGCASCEGGVQIFPRSTLAAAGGIFYASLLVLAVLRGPHPIVCGGTLLGAGVHAGLVALLVEAQRFCLPCMGAAIGAGLALWSALCLRPANLYRASLLVPAAALAVQAWGIFGGASSRGTEPPAGREKVGTPEFSSPAPDVGTVRMLLYTRPDCGYCRELERLVLPELVRKFGETLLVERRCAESLPGIPTPTILLSGSGGRRLFPGLPPTELLEETIRILMGGGHGRETVLEKSR